MARLAEQFSREADDPRTAEQRSVCEEVKRRFGWRAESVQFLKGGRELEGVCTVKVGVRRTVLIVFANGLLVGIPPKKGKRF
jgi:hypothetical protein